MSQAVGFPKGGAALLLLTFVSLHLLACGSRTDLSLWGQPDPTFTLNCPSDRNDDRLSVLSAGFPGTLDASKFFVGEVTRYRWSIVARDCDALSSSLSYRLENVQQAAALFTPGRPFDYRVRLEVADVHGNSDACEFEQPVRNEGLRIELCWTSDSEVDLDLFLHSPHNERPFMEWGFNIDYFGNEVFRPVMTADSCNVYNCTPTLRGNASRVDFGYPDSPLEFCASGPSGEEYERLGICPNPRAGIDSNATDPSDVDSRGETEVIQLDVAEEGDIFRVMVRNFNNLPTFPMLFVYCNGQRMVFEGPDEPPRFMSDAAGDFGVMWRPADIVVVTTDRGLDCEFLPLIHPEAGGPYVTIDDPSY